MFKYLCNSEIGKPWKETVINPISATGNGHFMPSVLIHLVEVLERVAHCEPCPERLAQIRHHGILLREDGLRTIANASDRATLEDRMRRLLEATNPDGHTA